MASHDFRPSDILHPFCLQVRACSTSSCFQCLCLLWYFPNFFLADRDLCIFWYFGVLLGSLGTIFFSKRIGPDWSVIDFSLYVGLEDLPTLFYLVWTNVIFGSCWPIRCLIFYHPFALISVPLGLLEFWVSVASFKNTNYLFPRKFRRVRFFFYFTPIVILPHFCFQVLVCAISSCFEPLRQL